jgi:hypothetical protein
MRLSGARGRCRQSKALYPNHRYSPWRTEDAVGANRWLGDKRVMILYRLPEQ